MIEFMIRLGWFAGVCFGAWATYGGCLIASDIQQDSVKGTKYAQILYGVSLAFGALTVICFIKMISNTGR